MEKRKEKLKAISQFTRRKEKKIIHLKTQYLLSCYLAMKLEKLYDKAYDFVIIFGPKLVLGILALIVGLWFVKILVKWIHNGMHKRDVDPTAKPFLLSLVGVALRVLLILGVMQIWGIEMTIFTALVAAFGVSAGLALSGTLQNFASGVIILLVKPFVVGDNIVTQGLEGTVKSIQIFYTFITTFDNRSVIVPNSKLSNEIIINISREGSRRLDMEFKFKPEVDFEQLREIIDRAIAKCENILAKPERRIGISAIELDGYKVMVNVWLDAHGFQDTKLAIQNTIWTEIRDANAVKKA
jgi:small conductance mechanosensitive channel